jgi:hypothetical protein
MRRVLGLVLATQPARNFGRQATQRFASRINHEPVAPNRWKHSMDAVSGYPN